MHLQNGCLNETDERYVGLRKAAIKHLSDNNSDVEDRIWLTLDYRFAYLVVEG